MRDRGHAAVELALGAGLMLLPAAIVVLAFGPWAEHRVTAEAIAAEAARIAVIELDVTAGNAGLGAHAAAAGIDPARIRVGWCGAPPTVAFSGDCAFTRGSVVSVTVDLWSPLVPTPWGRIGGIWVSATHTEAIDLYRSLG